MIWPAENLDRQMNVATVRDLTAHWHTFSPLNIADILARQMNVGTVHDFTAHWPPFSPLNKAKILDRQINVATVRDGDRKPTPLLSTQELVIYITIWMSYLFTTI